MEQIRDKPTYGGSAGQLPNQVSKKKLPTKSQKTKRRKGE